ncbi:class I adenylate-forming enzyme family protein [Caldithrix abyssi]|uniref:Acyl-CoA synthetase (AMP-forming)/AMP-acid ligase II n=2 Tax=Caldithrix abyssi DSM 13497 TaxID=880073 RepID=A0A1J1C4Y5_CALAY|nr:class I adenylate-forming enzyme family protein [Caldithrix abyssi]APF17066.1 Acyl-CoA synthetase (AMP-forming)/AMP-acid ligase II [Caldithrix abyssi DSM 13497]
MKRKLLKKGQTMAHTKFVHSFLEDSAQRYPDKDAFFVNNRWYTFAYIERHANQLARFLIDLGVRKGDRVAFYIENSVEYVITYYAILKIGAITVALNTEATAMNVDYILQDCDVQNLIVGQKFYKRLQSLIEKDYLTHFIVWNSGKLKNESSNPKIKSLPEACQSFPSELIHRRIIDLDVASIVYTSGSTGQPRGATLTHLNIVTNTRSIVDYLELTADDRIMVVLPFYYIYGKSLLNTHFFVGGSVVVDNRFMFPNVVLKTMQEQKVTGFSGVPSTFTILLHRSNVRKMQFDSLRYVTQAGGAMAPAVQKEVAQVFAPAKLFIMYGATEASARLSYLDPEELPRKWGSIGKGIPNVDLFIADANGNRLPPETQGEIVARGANIMLGYWNHPEETRKVLKHGLYYTGDLGVMDEEGFIYVVGRSKDMIKIGGNRASAKEIEDALYEHPQVADAAVIGVADDTLGEAPKAFVVLKDRESSNMEETLRNFLAKRLASYKIPKYFEFRENLPKNKSGKIQKLKLVEEEKQKQ